MVARAIMLRPRVIVADEPVSMVDASLRATTLESLYRLRQEDGVSLVYVTHDLTTAWQLADRVMVMRQGEVVEDGAWPERQRALLRVLVTGTAGSLDLSLDQDHAILHRLDGAPRDLSPPSGSWTYDCEGPVRALIAAARGEGIVNLAPGAIGAATVGVLAAWQNSAGSGAQPMPVFAGAAASRSQPA